MIKEPTITLLKIITNKRALLKFKKYLDSPYFCTNKIYLELFSAFKKYKPDYEGISKENIFKSISSNKSFNDSSLQNYLSGFNGHMRDFLAQQEYQKRTDDKNIDFLNAIKNDKVAQGLFTKKAPENLPSKKALSSFEVLQQQFNVTELIFLHKTVNTKDNITLNSLLDALQNYFLALLLKYTMPTFARQEDAGIVYDIQFLEVLLPYIESRIAEKPAIVKLYYALLCFWRNKERKIDPLLQTIALYKNDIPKYDLQQFYLSITNFYALSIRKARKANLKILFKLFKDMLEEELFFSYAEQATKKISQFDYKNIVSVALQNEEPILWVREFVKAYDPLLIPSTDARKVRVLVRSWLLFAEGEYVASLQNFTDFRDGNYFVSVDYQLNYSILYIKCWFEIYFLLAAKKSPKNLTGFVEKNYTIANEDLQDFAEDRIMQSLESFRTYLSRFMNEKPSNKPVGENCKAFISVVHRLMVKPSSELKEIIARQPGVREVNWLNQKIELRRSNLI